MARSAARPTGPGRLSAEEAAKLPDRLLDAALKLFTERGYAQTTMDEIAREAGASTKTVYSRFANKGEIMQAVVQRNVGQITERVASSAINPMQGELRAFLLALGAQIGAAFDKETTGITRLTYAEAYHFPLLADLYAEVTGRAVTGIRRGLERAREEGLLETREDLAQAAALCFGMMSERPRISAVLGRHLTRAEIQAHVAAAVDLFLRGCGYAQPETKSDATRKRPQRRPPERR
ncbi:MAG: TetR/AcrR family transcriptional regulator [Hyphomonadaceae bacterium]|nr:TetR/AcrR family transcriptional regulator [Hyphomonadaceae bacterium]